MVTELKDVQKKAEEIADEVVDSLDLDLGVKDGKQEQGGKVPFDKSQLKIQEEEEETEEEEVEEESSEEAEAQEEGSEEEKESPEEDEDVIPYSKYKKLQEATQKRIDKLTSEIRELQEKKPEDSRRIKLEKMSESELKTLKRDVRREFKLADSKEREDQLLDLEEEIDDIIVNAPKRFSDRQVRAYNEMVEEVTSSPKYASIDFDSEAKQIRDIATEIYNSNPDLKNIEKGQAMALKFAVEHYAQIRNLNKNINQGKAKETSYRQKVTTLKKKASLGISKSANVVKDKSTLTTKDLDRARKGGMEEKADFVGKLLGDAAIDSYLK